MIGFKRDSLFDDIGILEKRIFKENNFSITLDVGVPCLIWHLKGVPASSEFYRNSVISFMDCYAHFKPQLSKLQTIIDGSDVGGVRPKDLEWACQWWSNRVKEYGNTLFAMVKPKNVFGMAALDTYLALPPSPWVNIAVFDNVSEAKNWIRNSNNNMPILNFSN